MKAKIIEKKIKKWSEFLAEAAICKAKVYPVGSQFVYDEGSLPSGMTGISAGDILNLQRENGMSSYDVPGSAEDWVRIDGNPGDGSGLDLTVEQTLTAAQKQAVAQNINDRPAQVDSETVLSMGYKVLNPAMSFAKQVTEANTIYEIKDSFDLGGGSVTVPENCTLKFNGGRLRNGTLVGANTLIEAPAVKIFEQGVYKYRGYTGTIASQSGNVSNTPIDLTISGTWMNETVCVEWFDITNNPQIDASRRIANLLRLYKDGIETSLPCGDYYIFATLGLYKPFNGNGCTFYQCNPNNIYDSSLPIPEGKTAVDTTIFKSGVRAKYQLVAIMSTNVKRVRNFTIDGQYCTAEQVGFARPNGQPIGTIGLIGCKATSPTFFENISILNPAGNGFLGISSGAITLEGCYFYGSGEHQLYVRPTKSYTDVTIRRCRFENWENDEIVAGYRGSAMAIKCQCLEGGNLYIEDSYIGTSPYSNNSASIIEGSVKIANCTFGQKLGLASYDIFSTCEIRNSKIAGLQYTDFPPILSIYNTTCGTDTLSYANFVIDCKFTNYTNSDVDWRTVPTEHLTTYTESTTIPTSSSEGTIIKYTGTTTSEYTKNHYYIYKEMDEVMTWVDETDDITNKLNAQNKRRELTIINSVFTKTKAQTTLSHINGCKNLIFANCTFINLVSNNKAMAISKYDNDSILRFVLCSYISIYNMAIPFISDFRKIYLIGNNIITGNPNDNYSTFNAFITIQSDCTCYTYNNKGYPYVNNAKIPNIAGSVKNATNVTISELHPEISNDYKAYQKGVIRWNETTESPNFWSGTAWVDANGEPVSLQVSDTSVLVGSAAGSVTINVYHANALTVSALNPDNTPATWLTVPSTIAVGTNTLTITANSANSTNPRGAKVIISDGTDVVIVNVVQNYSTT